MAHSASAQVPTKTGDGTYISNISTTAKKCLKLERSTQPHLYKARVSKHAANAQEIKLPYVAIFPLAGTYLLRAS